MPRYAVDPPVVIGIPVAGQDALFPVRRVYCVGRNYADHALEMGIDPRAEEPFFFLKPADAVISSIGDTPISVAYPPGTRNLHHEVELVVAIGESGTNLPVETASRHIWGYAAGIDLTRRDLQLAMRGSGKPWEIGKTFERCAPVSAIIPIAQTGEITSGAITLDVNADRRQSSDLSKLIWSISEIVAKLSGLFTLEPGDLIFTGTPEGVSAIIPGDTLVAEVEKVGRVRVTIVAAR